MLLALQTTDNKALSSPGPRFLSSKKSGTHLGEPRTVLSC